MAKFRKKPVVIEAVQWMGDETGWQPLRARNSVSKQLGTCNSEPRLAHTKANHGVGCIGWKPVAAPAEYTCPRCGSNVSTHICMGEPVAGETKYAPLDTKACFNTAAHFEHSWDYRNKTFRCLGKSIAPSVAVPVSTAGMTARVFVDMDGVVVDFDSFKNERGLTGEEVKALRGAYLEMKPFPDAIAGIKTLIGAGFDVWLASKPPTGVPHAYSDKAAWVFEHLPELRRKLILTHDKGLLGCERDFLIDDRPHKANCERFRGTLIRFTDGETWTGAIAKIRAAHVLAEKGK